MSHDLDIPDFLKRRKGERPTWQPVAAPAVVQAEETWRRLERERAEQRKLKSRGRVAKMLSIKSDRAAAAAGKTWDTSKGQWI